MGRSLRSRFFRATDGLSCAASKRLQASGRQLCLRYISLASSGESFSSNPSRILLRRAPKWKNPQQRSPAGISFSQLRRTVSWPRWKRGTAKVQKLQPRRNAVLRCALASNPIPFQLANWESGSSPLGLGFLPHGGTIIEGSRRYRDSNSAGEVGSVCAWPPHPSLAAVARPRGVRSCAGQHPYRGPPGVRLELIFSCPPVASTMPRIVLTYTHIRASLDLGKDRPRPSSDQGVAAIGNFTGCPSTFPTGFRSAAAWMASCTASDSDER